MFALIDCNNFFVSCEQVFRPDLEKKPTLVLSSNDGCVVARSNEVKQLGIKMGTPYFEIAHLVRQHSIHVFSSNFGLYSDMSQRVMQTLRQFTPEVEIYSIDEAFIRIADSMQIEDQTKLARQIRAKIRKWTGIPISVGIAPTKTLAKLASGSAKKTPQYQGVLNLNELKDLNNFLGKIEVGNVWGIGRHFTEKLNRHGIYTALDLIQKDDRWIRKNLTLGGLHTAYELRGISCISLESIRPAKKQIMSSQSFANPVKDLQSLKESVATHATSAAEKLRHQNSVASGIIVSIRTNPHAIDNKYFSSSTVISLPVSTNYTPDLISAAHQALVEIYRPNLWYKKTGVTLIGLEAESQTQLNIFHQDQNKNKKKTLSHAIDHINQEWGRGTLKSAGLGLKFNQHPPKWHAASRLKSQQYTTDWDQIPRVNT